MSKKGLIDIFSYFIIAISLFLALGPIVWMILTSIKSPLEAFSIPPVLLFAPTIENYRFVTAHAEFFNYFKNSLIIGVLSTTLSVSIGSLAAYSFARFDFRGNKNLAFWILSTRMFPPIASIIPLYLLMRAFNLLDTHIGLILIYTVFNLPFVVWMMRGSFMEIPVELDESAMVDGCSRIGALLRIIFPLVRPGLVAATIFCLVMSWNEFLFALILTGTRAKTLPVAVTMYLTVTGIKWGPVSAAGTLIILPVLIFSMFVQKHLIRGLTFGAVKK